MVCALLVQVHDSGPPMCCLAVDLPALPWFKRLFARL